jgi:peptidoglycan-N-acetylglucosamine deacetylase
VKSGIFVMTVDVDSWSSLLRFYSVKHDAAEADSKVGIEYGLRRLLELLRKHDITATFFVPGEVVENQREPLKLILQGGHELGCHGLTHDKDEFLLPYDQQFQRIKEATRLLEKGTGHRPRGFRAPCLRTNGVTVRALEALDYVYDSSVLPGIVPGYYGELTLKLKPYVPSNFSIKGGARSRIWELPVSVNPFLRIPLSAAWMRNLGSDWLKTSIRLNYELRNPVVFYVHPRDVSPLPRVEGVPWHLYKNVGLKGESILDGVLNYAKKNGEVTSGIELTRRLTESAG